MTVLENSWMLRRNSRAPNQVIKRANRVKGSYYHVVEVNCLDSRMVVDMVVS